MRLATSEDTHNRGTRKSRPNWHKLHRFRPGFSRCCSTISHVLAPLWRPLAAGCVAAGATVFLVSSSSAAPSPSPGRLRAENASIAQQKRSAVLSLYSLDARLATAEYHLAALQRQAGALRKERQVLQTELRLAQTDARVSQQRLARRLRALYDHGGASSLDLIFGAQSIGDALTQLDNLDRVTSVNKQIL